MTKPIEFLKTNKKTIIVVALLIVLIAVLFFMNSSEGDLQSASTASTKSQTEIKLTEILSSINGVGETQVMISENDGEICGVVIVCSGGDNIITRNDILNAVSTALCINKNLIAIYSMKN